MIAFATLWLCLVNLWTFRCFGEDKRRAVHGLPRMLEFDLIGLSLIGGTAGAFAGRAYYHHKTRKKEFSNRLRMIAIAQMGVLVGFGWNVIAPTLELGTKAA